MRNLPPKKISSLLKIESQKFNLFPGVQAGKRRSQRSKNSHFFSSRFIRRPTHKQTDTGTRSSHTHKKLTGKGCSSVKSKEGEENEFQLEHLHSPCTTTTMDRCRRRRRCRCSLWPQEKVTRSNSYSLSVSALSFGQDSLVSGIHFFCCFC